MPTSLLYTAIGMKNYHPLSSSDRAGVLSLNMQPPESALRCPECKSTDVIRRGTVNRKVYAPPIGLVVLVSSVCWRRTAASWR
jgi:hypothetical protein